MPFNPTEFYEFANWLKTKVPASDGDSSVVRTIISRAYYSALLNTSEVVQVDTLGSHQGVIRALRNRRQNMGNKLYDLKVLREKADYEVTTEVSIEDANKALRDAKYILDYLNNPINDNASDYLNLSEA